MKRTLAGNGMAFLVACVVWTGASAAEAQPGTIPVNVESTPPGATVYVDSASTAPIGTTPLTNVRIARGNHTLFFRLANHEDGQLQVNIRRRRETFRVILNPLSTISVTAGNSAAENASVRVDGQPLGNIPYRGTVQPGRHLVQIGREGYVTFSQWVELAGGQVLTLPVMLEREAPQTGSILIAGDVSGAPIFIDGTPRGATPTVIEGITAGEHQIEIRPDGMDVFQQSIRVIAGERLSVNPTMRPAPARAGSLRVIANAPNAAVTLDGEVIGQAPVTQQNVTPGEHILEATADGYETVQQPVTVEPGQQRVVSLRLERRTRVGRIVVNANVGGATVTVDGEERGPAPVVIEGPTAGAHAILVTAEGHEEFRTTCETGDSEDCEVTAQLRPIGTPVRVEANVSRAELFIDGESRGPLPYEGAFPVGEHRLEVRAEGYTSHVEQVNLVSSTEPRGFNIALVREGELTQEERATQAAEEQRRREGAATHAAAALPSDLAIIDVSLGWPHIAEVRLGVGIFDWLEGGFGMRTFGRLTEFEGRAKIGVRPVRQVSVAAQARFGGGIGPSRDATDAERAATMNPESHSVNSVFFNAEVLGTLHFSARERDQAAFTLWLGLDFASDGYDWTGADSDVLAHSPVAGVMTERDGRQNTASIRLGGSLELVLSRHWNIWGLLEGNLAGPGRDVYGNIFGIETADTELYFRLGLTHKF